MFKQPNRFLLQSGNENVLLKAIDSLAPVFVNLNCHSQTGANTIWNLFWPNMRQRLKMGQSRPRFCIFSSFLLFTVDKCSKQIASVWIQNPIRPLVLVATGLPIVPQWFSCTILCFKFNAKFVNVQTQISYKSFAAIWIISFWFTLMQDSTCLGQNWLIVQDNLKMVCKWL